MLKKTYEELLKRSKEAVEAAVLPIRAHQMRKRGEIKILELDESIMAQQTKIDELAGKHPLDFEAVLDAIDKLELMERRRRKFLELLADLFPNSKVIQESSAGTSNAA